MSHSSRRNFTSPSIVNGAGLAAIAAFVVAAGAVIPTASAAAAASNEGTAYCLSGDGISDCSFTSRAQCEASASGGLGICTIVPAWHEPRDRYAIRRLVPRPRG